MATASKLPVYSVEADARNFGFAKMRLSKHRNVHLSFGDSREFLMNFIAGTAARYTGHPLLFYLDAHWGEDLPLSDELVIILSSFSHVIVLIDDFQVPGDEGYGYDDYGAGKALSRGYIAPHVSKFQLAEFYPTTPSAAESVLGVAALCWPMIRVLLPLYQEFHFCENGQLNSSSVFRTDVPLFVEYREAVAAEIDRRPWCAPSIGRCSVLSTH